MVDADLSCPHCRAGTEQFSPTHIQTYGSTEPYIGRPPLAAIRSTSSSTNSSPSIRKTSTSAQSRVMVLCYSRMMYLEFTLGEALEHFLGCQENALEVL
jgi:hypothetical protein